MFTFLFELGSAQKFGAVTLHPMPVVMCGKDLSHLPSRFFANLVSGKIDEICSIGDEGRQNNTLCI